MKINQDIPFSPRVFLWMSLLIFSYFSALWTVFFTGWNDFFTGEIITFNGQPLGRDFIYFWVSGQIASEHGLVELYSSNMLVDRLNQLANMQIQSLFWPYPPVFSNVLSLLGGMSYHQGLIAWVLIMVAIFAIGIYHYRDWLPKAWYLILFLPPVVYAGLFGHNGLLTSGLLIWGFYYISRNQRLAGVIWAMLLLKPHFALVVAIIVIAQRRWQACLWGTITAIMIIAASVFISGIEPWWIYINIITAGNINNSMTALYQPGMTTIYNQIMYVTNNTEAAFIGQLVAALGAACIAYRLFRKTMDERLQFALFTFTIFVIAPHHFGYDTPIIVLASLGIVSFLGDKMRYIDALIIISLMMIVPLQLFYSIGGLLLLIGFCYVIHLHYHSKALNENRTV